MASFCDITKKSVISQNIIICDTHHKKCDRSQNLNASQNSYNGNDFFRVSPVLFDYFSDDADFKGVDLKNRLKYLLNIAKQSSSSSNRELGFRI